MSKRLVVFSVFAEDRPGGIQSISDVVLQFNGNWLESTLSRLQGQFAGLVHIEVDAAVRDGLIDALASLSEQGIEISQHSSKGVVEQEGEVNLLEIMIEANDRPGIIGEITTALGQKDINIDSMESGCESASMAGYSLFRAHLQLALPDGVSEDELYATLESVSDDLMISVVED